MFGLIGVQSRHTLRPISASFRVPFIGPIPLILSQNLKKKVLSRKSVLTFRVFFSSPEPSGSQGELIVYPYSGVRCRRCRRRQQCLNISSETALPIKAKFYVEPPWEGGTKFI